MKYREWLSEWLENYVKPTAKPRTYERYRQLICCHISGAVGEKETDKLTPLDVQKMITEFSLHGNLRTGGAMASSTLNGIITVVQESMKTAFLLGIVPAYSMDRIKRPKITEKKVECFTAAEQRRIEQAVFNSKKAKVFGIVLCLYTGLRIGELLALEWSDIDIKEGILSVNKTCCCTEQNGKQKRIVTAPKTPSSIRRIPLPKPILPLLRLHRKKAKSPYVIEENGRFVTIRSYQKTYEILLKNAEIDYKSFHSLRHTFATRALECGMDVKTLSEILGHKNPTVTLTRYAHSMPEHKKKMMNRLGDLLTKKGAV